MNDDPRRQHKALARSVFMAYEQAVRMGEHDVSEHLLRALEELALRDETCCRIRDEAYLLVARRGPSLPGR